MPFAVLIVCTGNVCRSPAAERLLAARVPPAITVSSAGLGALAGRGVDGPMALALSQQGVDPDGHVARQFTPGLLAAADLVLTAEAAQRNAILHDAPAAMPRTFTLREFGRLGAALPPLHAPVTEDALRDRVRQVAAQRGAVPAPAAGADDVGDPFGAPLAFARATLDQLVTAVDGVVAALGLG